MPEDAIYLRLDAGYLPFARALLASLRENFPNHPQILADYPGEDPEVLRVLEAFGATCLAPEQPPEFAKYLNVDGDAAILSRLRLWRSAFRQYRTILHLDADMLVLAPLGDLLKRPEPFFVANHEADPKVRVFKPGAAVESRLAEDGIAPPNSPDDMANAGLFTLPQACRTRSELARLAQLAARYGRDFAFADQSLLSLWLLDKGQRPSLDFGDNFQTPFFTDPTISLELDDLRVLHFSSPRKPGTPAFDRWERVGRERARIKELFESYRDLPL